MIIANWDYAGTNKFVSHILPEGAKQTLCGLYMSERRGDWQDVDVDVPGCLRCRKAAEPKMHPTKNGRGKSDKVSNPAIFGG